MVCWLKGNEYTKYVRWMNSGCKRGSWVGLIARLLYCGETQLISLIDYSKLGNEADNLTALRGSFFECNAYAVACFYASNMQMQLVTNH